MEFEQSGNEANAVGICDELDNHHGRVDHDVELDDLGLHDDGPGDVHGQGNGHL